MKSVQLRSFFVHIFPYSDQKKTPYLARRLVHKPMMLSLLDYFWIFSRRLELNKEWIIDLKKLFPMGSLELNQECLILGSTPNNWQETY